MNFLKKIKNMILSKFKSKKPENYQEESDKINEIQEKMMSTKIFSLFK
jgi:hypothetical protein